MQENTKIMEYNTIIRWNTNNINAKEGRKVLLDLNPPETADKASRAMLKMCNAMMSKINTSKNRKRVYWWTTEIAETRKRCIAAKICL